MDYESCRDFLKRLGYVILICIAFHFKLDNFAFMIAFILIVIALLCFSYYKAKQQKADQEMDRIMNAPSGTVSAEVLPLNNNNMEENQNISTRDLCAEVLSKLNCDVQFDDENEYNMHFSYQGENFSVETWEDGLMITIWDTWWGTVDLDNLDDVSRVRKAINTINVRQGFTLMYSIDEKSQKFAVHTKRQCLLIPQIPQIENYMVAMLTGFFDAQRSFKEEYDRLRLEEEANAKV
jgi:Ca2+/Na+ antiporter